MIRLPGQALGKVVALPVEQISPNPMQPRRVFDPQELAGLAASIEQNGLLQPIVVTNPRPGHYVLVAGERRLRAFRLLGRAQIPAIVRREDDRAGAVLALVENLQRQQLNFLEEATAMAALMEAYAVSQKELAARLGMGQSTLANKLRLLRLPPEICRQLLEAGLGERHARALLCLEGQPDKLEKACSYFCSRHPTAPQAEQYARQLAGRTGKGPARILVIKDLRIFLHTVERAVQTLRQAGIAAQAEQSEDGQSIIYTVKVPKTAALRPARGNVPRETSGRRMA